MDPMVMLNLMVELAGLEEELAAARATVAHHRERDRHLRALHDEYAADAASAEAVGQGAAADLRRTEGRIKDVENLLARKRGQEGSIRDPRQLTALQAEIRNLEEELDKLETAGLELVDEVLRKDGDAGTARRERDDQDVRGHEEMEKMAGEMEQARAAEQEIVQEIERLVGLLPAGEGRHVTRLMSQLPQAVVRVRSGACGGCFSQLPAQLGIDAEKGRALVRCPSCTRYVVHESWK